MERQIVSLIPALALIAVVAAVPAPAGEQPGPGLEILDGGVEVDANPDAGSDYLSEPLPPPPGAMAGPGYFTGETPSTIPVPTLTPTPTPTPIPAADSDPFGAGGAIPDQAPAADDGATATVGGPAEPSAGITAAPAERLPGVAVYPGPDPVTATLNGMNVNNPYFPGLAGAVSRADIRAVGDIVWQAVRQRRIIDAALARGPGASAGAAGPSYGRQLVLDAINYAGGDPVRPDTPLNAAYRVNIILDAFGQPLVDDPVFGSAMPQAVVRLYNDIHAVRTALDDAMDDAAYQEMSRTFIRAATACDFFIFVRRELVSDINAIMNYSSGLFYPDGSSIGGDAGGVSGNLFHDLLMLDAFSRDDNRFRRDTAPAWRALERPARFLLDIAAPDLSVPRFGPRGSRELTPVEMTRLGTIYPKPAPRVSRIGLAASASYPEASNLGTYGGVYVSRSGNDSGARHLAIRFGPEGMMRGVPPHHDFGSMELMSRNIKFIVDGGGYAAEAALPGAHSGLSLDGQNVELSTYNEPGRLADAVWRTNAGIDYVTDKAGFPDGKSWQRAVLYVKDLPGETRSDYWVVLDNVDMQGDNQPRQALVRYQLAPGIQAYNDGSGIIATAGPVDGSALRIFAVDANAQLTVSEGGMGTHPSYIHDIAGGSYAAPAVTLSRDLIGDSTTTTILYPAENISHRPARIERDADIIRGRTGTVVVDHGQGRIDVIAWSPPGAELVTPTLNLQMSADIAVFRIRNGKFARVSFVNLERFQAKEPGGGLWSARVDGPAQTLTFEPEQSGGWQILSDPANRGAASLYEVNLGPAITRRRLGIKPGDMRLVAR